MATSARVRGSGGLARVVQPLRRARDIVFFPARAVLPLYHPQRSGLVTLGRRFVGLAVIVFVSMVYGLLSAILPPSMLLGAAAPLAILALFVIWALPEADKAPTKLLLRCYVLFMILAIVWPNYLSLSVAGLPWISFRRLFGVLTTLLLLVCYSISPKFRRDMAVTLSASPWLARFMLGFLIIQIIASLISSQPSVSIGRLVNISLTVTPFFFATLWCLGSNTRTPEWWVRNMLGCVSVLMVIGFFEFRAEHVLWVGHIPSWLQINDPSVILHLTSQVRGTYRVMNVFGNPLVWGELVAMTIPFAIHLMVNSRSVSALALTILFDLAMVLSAYWSGARLSMVGMVVAHATYLLLWGLRRWIKERGGLVGISTTMMYPAFAVVLAVMIMVVPAVHNRVLGGGATQASNDGRHEQIRMGLPKLAMRPVFGYGPFQSAEVVGWRSQSGFLSIDSGFLSTAVDYGVLGFIAFYGTMVLGAGLLIRAGLTDPSQGYPLHLAVATTMVVLLNTRLVLSQTDNDQVFFMLVGLTFALLYRSKQARGA